MGRPTKKPKSRSKQDSQPLQDTLQQLWAEAGQIWDRHENDPGFHAYVSSDYSSVYEALRRLQGRVLTVLEWGSGLGVVTIMADLMGFEAYGIEAELTLVELSEGLAKKYGASAKFAHGSFIPEEFEWDPASGDEDCRTMLDIEPAYSQLDMELRDFDLVFAYPWPTEHALYRRIMRDSCGDRTLLLMYDAREGLLLQRCRAR